MTSYVPSLRCMVAPSIGGLIRPDGTSLLPSGKTLPEPCWKFIGHPSCMECNNTLLDHLNHEGCVAGLMSKLDRNDPLVVDICAYFGYTELLKKALDFGFAVGPDVDRCIGFGGSVECARMLDPYLNTNGALVVIYDAARYGHLECMKFGLNSPTFLSATSSSTYLLPAVLTSAFRTATIFGQRHIVEYLADLGATK